MAGNAPVITTVIVGIIIVAGIASYAFYSDNNALTSLSQQNSNLNQQLVGLNQQNTNLVQQLSSLSQQNSNLNQQVGNLNEQLNGVSQAVSTLEQRTVQVVTITDMVVSVETTTSVTTTTQTSISQVPTSSLIVVSDSYSNTTKTFTFNVQNTQNYTVLAQLSASLWGATNFGCNGQVGTFISQVYTFTPGETTTTQLNLALGTYAGFCGGQPLSSIQMNFVIPQSTPVSPTYSFIVVPNYIFP